MQLLLIRHGRPGASRPSDAASDEPADPPLTQEGLAQAERLVGGCRWYTVSAIISSDLARARETAEPLAREWDLPVHTDENLAEYDRDRSSYVPMDDPAAASAEEYRRIRAGLLPAFVDGAAFRERVERGVNGVISTHRHEETVAVFCHGGVINVYLQHLLGLDRPLVFPVEYASITRILISRDGTRRVASVNETGHVRDLLRRAPPHSSGPDGEP